MGSGSLFFLGECLGVRGGEGSEALLEESGSGLGTDGDCEKSI